MAVNDPRRFFALFSLLLIVAFSTGCIGSSNSSSTGNAQAESGASPAVSIDKLEVYHFHGTHQCYSCITVGGYAEETVNTYFADELKSGKIVFGHINRDLEGNQDLVLKYGATGSSLWLGTYSNDGTFKAEQNINVWYKINDKQACMEYLKGVIEQKLAGN